jgi:hypothetical protein
VKDDVVFINGECERDGVRFRVEQRPVVQRLQATDIEFLGSERLSKLSLEYLADLDRRYFEAVDKNPPERYDLVQRMIRWACKVKSDAEVLDVVENATLDTDLIAAGGIAAVGSATAAVTLAGAGALAYAGTLTAATGLVDGAGIIWPVPAEQRVHAAAAETRTRRLRAENRIWRPTS